MTISERIESDIRMAMKAREKDKLTYLRNFKSALHYRALDKHDKLTEEEEITVLSSTVKKLRDSIEQAKQGGREDIATKTQAELDLALTYMPEQMGEEEVKKIVQETIDQMSAGPADFGKVMGAVMGKVKGQADGGVVNKTVKELLG